MNHFNLSYKFYKTSIESKHWENKVNPGLKKCQDSVRKILQSRVIIIWAIIHSMEEIQ